MYRLSLSNLATKALDRLQGSTLERIGEAILRLSNNPSPPGYIKIKGDEAYRSRVGDYRIVYDVDDSQQSAQAWAPQKCCDGIEAEACAPRADDDDLSGQHILALLTPIPARRRGAR